MSTIADDDQRVIAGVDTHKDVHVAVVLDELGRKLDTATFATTTRGYRDLHRLGDAASAKSSRLVSRAPGRGVPGLSRHLAGSRVERDRGEPTQSSDVDAAKGKSDPIDAEMAARAVLAGDATVIPKAGDGPVEALRQLRLARSGRDEGPHRRCEPAAQRVRHRTRRDPRPAPRSDDPPQGRDRVALPARRSVHPDRRRETCAGQRRSPMARLDDEITELDRAIKNDPRHHRRAAARASRRRLRNHRHAALRGRRQPRTARHRSRASPRCAAPHPSRLDGNTNRRRLNRAGDRRANSALWTIVMVRTPQHNTHRPSPTSNDAPPKDSPNATPSAASSATSHARSTTTSAQSPPTHHHSNRRLTPRGASVLAHRLMLLGVVKQAFRLGGMRRARVRCIA